MKTIQISKIFKDDQKLLDSLHKILNIPNKEVRNAVLKAFCQHPQMKTVLEKSDLLPLYFYYILLHLI